MINPYLISQSENRKRQSFRCVHRHNGTVTGHPNCYDQANGLVERVAIIDIESSQLNASFGIILSYVLLSTDKKTIFKRSITQEELRTGVFDRALCEQFCKDVRNFDRLIGYYSEKFDIPMLRTRCLFWGCDFPLMGEIKHTDLWRIVRQKLRIHSNRLSAVCPFFEIKAKTHPLLPSVWIKCLSGDKDSLKFVETHNIEDCYSTLELFNKMDGHYRLNKTSI